MYGFYASWVCIDVAAESSSGMNIELYRSMLSAHAKAVCRKLRGVIHNADDSWAAKKAPDCFNSNDPKKKKQGKLLENYAHTKF